MGDREKIFANLNNLSSLPIPDAVLAIGHPAGVHWLPIDAIQAFPSGESMRVHYVVCVLSCESGHCGVYFAGSGQHVSPTRCCCHKSTTMAHEVFWIGNLTSTSKKKVIKLRMRSLLKHSELTRNPISSRQSAVRVSWGQKNQKELRDSADSQRLLTSSMRWEWIAPFSDLRWCSAKSNTVCRVLRFKGKLFVTWYYNILHARLPGQTAQDSIRQPKRANMSYIVELYCSICAGPAIKAPSAV